MKNIFGITDIKIKRFLIQTVNDECFDELNDMISRYDGNVLDVQFVGQAMGQICAIVIYKKRIKDIKEE